MSSPMREPIPWNFMTLDHDGGKTLLFGKPGDLVSSEDARLALLLVEARLGSVRIAAIQSNAA